MEENKNNVYFVKSVKNEELEREFEWGSSEFTRDSKLLFNMDSRAFERGEVYEYVVGVNPFSKEEEHGYCVIMETSYKYDNKVLVCRLLTEKEAANKFSMDIGFIPCLGFENKVFAYLKGIRYVSKSRFKLNKEKNLKNVKCIGMLEKSKYFMILEALLTILNSLRENNTYYCCAEDYSNKKIAKA